MEHGYINPEFAPLLAEAKVSRGHEVRKAGMQRIEKDMSTVNKLFKDLSGLVIQQGETIQNVDRTVERTSHNSRLAREELEKSDKRQKQQVCTVLRFSLILFGFIISVFLLRRMMFSHW